ncbi:FSH1 [Candida margitis]|uniref:FSH1 n=1 Tax=Candida margitis TaxID=1775924 RepID=UPI002227E0B8|nr:FSH1 [Candida margitis]KAI5969068.1 FSH1 [Candida margitis]
MSSVSKVLCLPGYLQSGSTLARKSSGLRKILSKKLNIQLDYITPCHEIKSRHELSFPLGPTDEESDRVWSQIVDNGSNARWFDAQSANNYIGLDESIRFVIDHIEKNGPYDGIIGFSQGAAMAIMITNALQKMLPSHPPFKISMAVSGFCLTVPRSGDYSDENKQRILQITDANQYASEVEISERAAEYLCDAGGKSTGLSLPTEVILLYGKNDSIVPPIRSEYVSTLYDAKQVRTFVHEGGHLFPNDKKIVQPISELFDKKINGKL